MRNIVRLLTTSLIAVTLSGFGAIAGPSAFAMSPARSNQHHVKISDVMRNLRTGLAGPTHCYRDQTFQQIDTLKYVSAELGYTGSNYAMLRARASQVGPWELFTVCREDLTGIVTIASQANGLAVSAELGYAEPNYAMLRARASVAGPWEEFSFGVSAFGLTVILSEANAKYVSAELGYAEPNYAMLRARASEIGDWEQFNVCPAFC